jgi:hypothetical protein
VPDAALGYGIVNPYLAVTSVTADAGRPPASESAATLPARPAAHPPSRTLQHVALGVSLVLLGLAVIVGLAAMVLRGGRRRGARRADSGRHAPSPT